MLSVGAAIVIALLALALGAEVGLAHSGSGITVSDRSGFMLGLEFAGYGAKHILLGYDHLLFLGGLALLTTQLRQVVGVAGLFAIAYSATLVGGTLAGLAVQGDVIDAIIALSVGFVGAQIAFGGTTRWLPRDPRPPALVFGLAHGLGLSSLLQELRLGGDDLLASVLGFNAGVEAGQLAALALFVAALGVVRSFPFPSRQQIPAGFALGSASATLLVLLVAGVDL